MEFAKSLVEVGEVIKYLSKEDLEKIPPDIFKAINDNKDGNYKWKYDESKSLKQQKLSRTSIAILSFINLEYLLDEEQKKFINELHRYNERKVEQKKQENNTYSDLFNSKTSKKTFTAEKSLTNKEKDKWYNKIIEAFKGIFKNRNN